MKWSLVKPSSHVYTCTCTLSDTLHCQGLEGKRGEVCVDWWNNHGQFRDFLPHNGISIRIITSNQ